MVFAGTQNANPKKPKELDQSTLDLSAKNPNIPEEAPLRQPKEILKEMADLDNESSTILETIKELI